jgi:hypothetical protein
VIQNFTTRIYASQDSTGGGNNDYFFASFDGTTTGTYTYVNAEVFLLLGPMEYAYATDMEIVVTYFGDVGDFIQGTFTGTVAAEPSGGGTTYPILGTFSVIRE